VERLDVRDWDVTEPFRWQKEAGAMPLQPPTGPAFSKGFGFLLSGGLTIGQLAAEDNTNCLSELSNICLRATYTISEGQFNPPGWQAAPASRHECCAPVCSAAGADPNWPVRPADLLRRVTVSTCGRPVRRIDHGRGS
jgi:hypothetical protein